MRETDERALSALRSLVRASHLVAPGDLPDVVSRAGDHLGADEARVYLVDYDQVWLVPLTGSPPAEDHADALAIDGTVPGMVLSEIRQHASTGDDVTTLWTPVLDGTERVGVLMLRFPPAVEVDDDLAADALDVASLLAEMIITRSSYGDGVEQTRRRVGLSVAAELQWGLLPPLTFVSPDVSIAGVLAPATEVAGDCFDYALNGDTLHVAILDAMGHGLEATLLSAVGLSILRNCRRSGIGLASTVRAMDAGIARQFGSDKFVTGIIGELHVPSGQWEWATCGHPAAFLLRDGQVVKRLDHVVGVPVGLELLGPAPEVGHERLQPGDRLVLFTDGVTEARDADGGFFGEDRLADFVSREAADGRPVAEMLRRLNLAVLRHQEGQLQDDATTVLLEWRTNEVSRTGDGTPETLTAARTVTPTEGTRQTDAGRPARPSR